LTNDPAELTPFDPQILKLMIHNKMYSLALESYKTPFTVFNPKSGLTALDVMSFNYYYGYVCTALKKYNEAIQAFRKVLIHPSSAIHRCSVNAYKKYIIVSLLAGKQADFPKKCNEQIRMVLSKAAEEYKSLEDAMMTVKILITI